MTEVMIILSFILTILCGLMIYETYDVIYNQAPRCEQAGGVLVQDYDRNYVCVEPIKN